MPREGGKLSPKEVQHARPARGRRATLFGDGLGLYIQATSSADGGVRKSWVFRYEQNGVRRDMGLGALHTVSLAEARAKARALRQQLLDGIDPLEAKRERRAAQRLAEIKTMTFGQCVDAYLDAHEASWKNAKHRGQWRTTLTEYCRAIAGLPVKDIDTDLVLRVLTPLWQTRTETAKRLRGRIERVLAWAKGRGLRDGENPARWGGHLDEMLAAPSKIAPLRHHPAMPYPNLPAFIAELRECDGIAARALEWTIMTGARTGETVGAMWQEIDFDEAVWILPPSRTKTGQEHRVPLPRRCLEILSALPRQGARIFAGLAERRMWVVLSAMRPGATVHGFRSAFRTWAAEQTVFPHEVCEAALAHKVSDAVVRTYRRTDFFERRRALMEQWAQFCAAPPAADNVTPLRRGEANA